MGTLRAHDERSVLGTEYRDGIATGLTVAALLMAAAAVLIGWGLAQVRP